MGKPVWAVVCGKIRDRFEFNMTIAKLCDLRSQGLLDGILISTWSGQLKDKEMLKDTLQRLDIRILELDEEEIISEKNVNMSFWVQQYQLRQGILHVPNDVFILKCRTEFGIDKIKPFEDILKGLVDLSIGSAGHFPVPFCYRIGVMRLSISGPFWMVDGGFVGYRDDVLKMLPGSNTHYKFGLYEDLWADFAPWFNPFLNTYPFFAELQNISKRRCIIDAWAGPLIAYAKKTDDDSFHLPQAAITFFAAYFLILHTCFYKAESYLYTGDSKKPEKYSISARQLFFEDLSIGLYNTNNKSCIGNIEILHMVLNGECKNNELYQKLYGEIIRLQNEGELRNTHLTYEDYVELYDFSKNALKMDPDWWLEWKVEPIKEIEEIGFQEALHMLYGDVPMQEEDWNILYETADIVMEKQKQYRIFSTIRQYLPRTEQLPCEVYEDILGSALRIFAAADVKMCGKGLRQGNYCNNVPWLESRMQFFASRLSKVLTSGNYLSGIYNYCLYEAEKHRNNVFARKLFDVIEEKYHIGADYLQSDNYAEALFPQIKETVRQHCLEYEDDQTIKGMLNFLIDEFPDEGLDEDSKNLVLPYVVRRRMILPFAYCEADPIHKVLDEVRGKKDRRERALFAAELLKCIYVKDDLSIEDIRGFIQQEKEYLPSTLIWRVYFAEYNNISKILEEEHETINERDFVTLLQVINEKGALGENEATLLEYTSGNCLKKLVLVYYLHDEFFKRYPFFRIKGGNKLWMNIPRLVENDAEKELIRVTNNEGTFWPYGEDFPSESCFGAGLEIGENDLRLTVEFAAENSYKKDRLLEELTKEGFCIREWEKREICIFQTDYPVNEFRQLRETIEDAYKMLSDIEVKVLNSLNRT